MFYEASTSPASTLATGESGDLVIHYGRNAVSQAMGSASACTYEEVVQLLPVVDLSEEYAPPSWLDVPGVAYSTDAAVIATDAQRVAIRLGLHGLREAASHAAGLVAPLVALVQIGDLPDERIAKQTAAIARQISGLMTALNQLEM